MKTVTAEKSIAKNFIFNAIKTIMVVIFPLISFPYVSRVLGVDGIGSVQYCVSIISYFALFASLGINSYAVREGVKYKNDKKAFSRFVKEIFAINMTATLVVYVVFVLCMIMGVFRSYNSIIIACSFTIIFTTLAVEWVYQILEEYVYISIRTTLIQFVSLILMFVFIRDSSDSLVYAYITTFASGGYCIFNLFGIRKHVDFSYTGKLEIKRHMKAIFIIFGTTLSASIYLNLDIIMLGIMYGDYQVGLYSAAVKINIIIKNIITSISVVLLPRVSLYLANGEEEKYNRLLKKGANINVMLSVPAAAGLVMLSENIIYIFSGEAFLPGSVAAKILAVNIIFSVLDSIFYNQILIPYNKEALGCIGTIIGAVTDLALNFILIPRYKVNGAAIATLISELAVFIYFIICLNKIINLRNIFDKMYQYIIAVAFIILDVLVVKHFISGIIMALIISVPSSMLIYFLILLLLKNEIVIEGLNIVKNKLKKA